jgi:general secretion pathway protein A
VISWIENGTIVRFSLPRSGYSGIYAAMSSTQTSALIARYGLSEPPFSLSPDPRYLYLTPQHLHALAHIRFTVDDRQGLAVLYGDIGHGKSTLVRRLYDLYRAEPGYEVLLLTNPDMASALQLLKRITDACDLPRRRTKLDQMQEFENYLVSKYQERKNVLLMIDEAQQMHGPMFELIRQITNFESASTKLIQIILVGQNNLRNKLKMKRALLSRAAALSTLDPLTPAETRAMIEFRLSIAGRKDSLFEDESILKIHKLAKGVPREIVKICRLALTVAALNDLETIPPEAIEDAREA